MLVFTNENYTNFTKIIIEATHDLRLIHIYYNSIIRENTLNNKITLRHRIRDKILLLMGKKTKSKKYHSRVAPVQDAHVYYLVPEIYV